MVGDVLLFDTGDILPADGMLFQGSEIRHAPNFVKHMGVVLIMAVLFDWRPHAVPWGVDAQGGGDKLSLG